MPTFKMPSTRVESIAKRARNCQFAFGALRLSVRFFA